MSEGGVADYSGITYEKIERQMGVFWPVPHDPRRRPDGTIRAPRLFEPGSDNPVAKGAPGFYFPTARRGFNVVRTAARRRRRRVSALPHDRARREPVPSGRRRAASARW